MRVGALALTFCGVLLLTPGGIVGQGQSVELGIDGAVNLYLNGPTMTKTTIPTESFRVGFFVFNRLSFEPSLALFHSDGQNTDPTVSVSAWLSALLHITPDRSKTQPFIRPTAGVEHYWTPSFSLSQLKAGGFLGLKIPVASHISVRLEGGYVRGFESESRPEIDVVPLSIGISLFVP